MKHNSKLSRLVCFSLLLMVAFFVGCVAAIPIAVHYFKTDDNYVATANVDKNADEIWQAVGRLADKGEAEGRLKIVKKDDPEKLLKVTDDVQTAEVKVNPEETGGAKIIVKADVPGESKEEEQEKEKELAIRIMNRLCAEVKADCKIVDKQGS